MAVAALALAGCTKNETVDVADSNVIGFANAFVGNPTKAVTEVTTQSIDKFFVYGDYGTGNTPVFTNEEVAPNANGEWTYTNIQEWVDNQTYDFAAYYLPAKLESGVTYSEGKLTFSDYTVNEKSGQSDLLYAKKTGVASGDGNTPREKIEFTFDHMLSIVKFTLKSGFGEGVDLEISEFKFHGMNSVATCTDGTWSAWNTPLDASSAFTFKPGSATVTATEATDYTDNCLVIPQTFNDNVVVATFKVTATGTGITGTLEKTITAKIPADEWVKGYRYNYEATIDGQTLDVITFAAPTVEEWKDETINMVNDKVTSGEMVKEEVEP